MNIVCVWRGHHWKTIDEYKVEAIKTTSVEWQGRASMETVAKLITGYKAIHQECTQCGDRRVLHKS